MHIQLLQKGINETVKQYLAQPFDFLYESDIQSLLFCSLRKEFQHKCFVPQAKDVNTLFCQSTVRPINPIKSEFPMNLDSSFQRFDIAILDESQDESHRIWWQPSRVAIEIKLWQPDGTGGSPRDDVRKLRNYQAERNLLGKPFTGISMLFAHPSTDKWVKNITNDAICSEPLFPDDGVSFQLVTPDGNWKSFHLKELDE